MKILVQGATGRTGKLVIEEAVRRGHQISAIARKPEKLKDCRAPMLSAETNTNGTVAVKEGENLPKMVLSRNSAAEFFIKIIEDKAHMGEIIHFSNNID